MSLASAHVVSNFAFEAKSKEVFFFENGPWAPHRRSPRPELMKVFAPLFSKLTIPKRGVAFGKVCPNLAE